MTWLICISRMEISYETWGRLSSCRDDGSDHYVCMPVRRTSMISVLGFVAMLEILYLAS